MTSLSSLSRSRRLQNLAPFLAVVAALTLGACEDKHIGRPCDLGVDVSMLDPKLVTLNAQALECPSRICILPAKDKTTATGPFCTDVCSSDDDCADGEKGSGTNGDTRCMGGFACRRIIPNLATNQFSCKAVCVCKDFFLSDDPNTKPPSCP